MSSMKTTKHILQALTIFSMLFILLGNSFAAEKIFIKEYTYQASEIDSKVTSRAQALEQAKRLVLEELGTYLMSKTEVKDFAISSDKVTVLTAGVVQTEIFDEKWNGETYYLKARITADPDKVAKAIDRLRKDEGKTKELEESKKRADEALKEIARLKTELDTVRNDKTKQLAYANTINTLSAADWFSKGVAFGDSRDSNSEIEAYSKAIALNPNFTAAYNNRGIAYSSSGQDDRAIDDFNKVISLEPNLASGYKSRGDIYNVRGQYDRAINDYNKVISLEPDDVSTYYMRGMAYALKGRYDKAIEDYNEAIWLKPDWVDAYDNRANAYYNKGQYDRAIEDYNKVILLKPDYASAYFGRGFAYVMKGQYDRARVDFKRSCELGNNNGCETVKILERKR